MNAVQRQDRQDIATQDNKPQNAITALRIDLEKMAPQFAYALPKHIPVDRFMRVVMTAVQNNPKLLRCTRQSFFNACVKAAQDGLLPDGREGAIVPYGEDEGSGKSSSDTAQWMPMIAGLRKKVRNSGAITSWEVQVVQEGDEFDYALGDNPFLHHKPARRGGRTRPVLFAYSIATFPDGTKSREVMNIDQIKDIQSKSKAKKGPWSDPIFFPEMCRKTVARLHAKQLPMSTDLDTLLRRDDELYDFAAARERGKDAVRPPSVQAALDQFAGAAEPMDEPTPPLAPEPANDNVPAPPAANDNTPAPQAAGAETSPPASNARQIAYERGKEAKARGMARKATPPEYREPSRSQEAVAWDRGWSGEPLE